VNLLEWTKETIKNDKAFDSWLGERVLEWVPLCDDVISSLMEGVPFLVTTDRQRDWLTHYIVDNVNSISNNRPFVPIYSLTSLIPYSHKTDKIEYLDMIEDMLDITFNGNYKYWYIGKENSNIYNLVKRKEGSFVWLMDSEVRNSFYIKSYDDKLDLKLVTLFKLFNKTITASMFGEITL
jgi:hypothetical protein